MDLIDLESCRDEIKKLLEKENLYPDDEEMVMNRIFTDQKFREASHDRAAKAENEFLQTLVRVAVAIHMGDDGSNAWTNPSLHMR